MVHEAKYPKKNENSSALQLVLAFVYFVEEYVGCTG
jgi:hypothetical protein